MAKANVPTPRTQRSPSFLFSFAISARSAMKEFCFEIFALASYLVTSLISASRFSSESRKKVIQPASRRPSGIVATSYVSGYDDNGGDNMAALDWSQSPVVESVPDRRSVTWVFRDTRVPVATVFENLEADFSIDEITEQFHVTREQIQAVLEFAARSLDTPNSRIKVTKRGENMTALDWSQCPAVESIPGKVSGAWVFKHTRMPVATVFENLEAGLTVEEVMEEFAVTREQVNAVLRFAARSLETPILPPAPSKPADAHSL
jgi:uncharacterized protein (DUF433 family)